MDTEYIDIMFKWKNGLEFQKYCANFLRKKYDGAFQKIVSIGPLLDGGKDDYMFETKGMTSRCQR